MNPNPGHCPANAAGKRIAVKLRDGGGFTGPAATANWRLTGSRFDILEWELAG